MITIGDMAWMAGVIDLKGRLFFKKNQTRRPNNRQITLAVDSINDAVIRRLARLTNTSPEFRSMQPLSETLRRGCTEHCPDGHVHINAGGSAMHGRWTISGAGIVIVIESLTPFLTDVEIFTEAIAEIGENTPLSGRGASAVFGSLSRLRGVGWPLSEPWASALDGKTVALEPPVQEDESEGEEPLNEAA